MCAHLLLPCSLTADAAAALTAATSAAATTLHTHRSAWPALGAAFKRRPGCCCCLLSLITVLHILHNRNSTATPLARHLNTQQPNSQPSACAGGCCPSARSALAAASKAGGPGEQQALHPEPRRQRTCTALCTYSLMSPVKSFDGGIDAATRLNRPQALVRLTGLGLPRVCFTSCMYSSSRSSGRFRPCWNATQA